MESPAILGGGEGERDEEIKGAERYQREENRKRNRKRDLNETLTKTLRDWMVEPQMGSPKEQGGPEGDEVQPWLLPPCSCLPSACALPAVLQCAHVHGERVYACMCVHSQCVHHLHYRSLSFLSFFARVPCLYFN